MVSAIIPNYNHAPYLRERVESVLRQDYQDMEVILLDDGSTDGSVAIMEEYANHPRVKAIVKGKENSGNTFVQWRKGIEMAQGDYLWIAESDDVAAPEFVSTLVAILEKDPEITISFCQSKWIDQDGNQLHSTVYRNWKDAFVMEGKEFIRRYLLGYNFICNASAVVMRSSAARQVSRLCERYRASGDRQFWIEMAWQGKVSYVPQMLNGFRQHQNKVSNKANQTGQNTREDMKIYAHYRDELQLNILEKIRILLYHLRARLA